MKVNRNSWHYRLWKFGRDSPRAKPRDLCHYFWHIALIKVLFPLTVIAFALLGVAYVCLTIWRNPFETAIVLVMTIVIVAFIAGVVIWFKRKEEREVEEKLGLRPAKEPSVVRQYLAARKQKLCPLIEVVDEEEP